MPHKHEEQLDEQDFVRFKDQFDKNLQDVFKTYQEYKSFHNFKDTFVDRLKIIDPLNRPIYEEEDEEGEVQSTKVEEFKAALRATKKIPGINLDLPLKDKYYSTFIKLFSDENQLIINKGKQFKENMRSTGNFDLSFRDDLRVREFQENLKFFIDNKLVRKAVHEREKLEQYLKDIDR